MRANDPNYQHLLVVADALADLRKVSTESKLYAVVCS